jgi:hypothetical protein
MIKEKKTLLEKARLAYVQKQRKKLFNEEEIELGLAWARQEITLTQIAKVLNYKNQTHVYSFLSQCFRIYINLQDNEILKNNQK